MDPALLSFLQNSQQMGAAGSLGSGIAGLFSQNPASAGMPYEQDAMNQMPGYYQPYMQAGQHALGNLGSIYGNMLSNPGQFVNQIGSNFHQSPGFNFALNQAMQGGNRGMAAGGLAGSPGNQMQNMQTATGMGNQNYYNYLQNAEGMFGQGLQGEQGLAGLGFNAANNLGMNMGDIYNNMANMQYAGTQQGNQNNAAAGGGIMSGLAGLFGG